MRSLDSYASPCGRCMVSHVFCKILEPFLLLTVAAPQPLALRAHTCRHAYMHGCIHTYMHAYIHACIHTCIHTHTCMPASSACLHSYTPPRCACPQMGGGGGTPLGVFNYWFCFAYCVLYIMYCKLHVKLRSPNYILYITQYSTHYILNNILNLI